jgi:hypothetical protein
MLEYCIVTPGASKPVVLIDDLAEHIENTG